MSGWKLVDKQGNAVTLPADLPDFRGDVETVIGGQAPHKPSSTGRVYTMGGGEFFPSVFNLRFERE